ncbi:MAG: HAMP domain-containing histidine kinase [Deltaproteobacteria bacterium]|nr:HAMP domain-containing histidine kinase [Deltaproteobacteria bacterium]
MQFTAGKITEDQRYPASTNFPSAFRLFIRFAIAGLVGFIVISAILFQLWKERFERYLVEETKHSRAKYINAMVGHALTEKDFQGVKRGAQWQAFRNKIPDLFSVPEIIRVKLYNKHGDLIWSDVQELLDIAPAANKNPDLVKAIQGHVEAEISRLEKEEHRFERGNFRTLLELYVPIYFDESKTPGGVAEVYINIDPLYATLRQTSWLIGITVFGGLGLLLAISFISLGRAVTMIHKQNVELRAALKEIFRANRIKDDLVTNLAHEFRNPDAIRSYADLLLDGGFGDSPHKASASVENMRNTAAELLSHFNRTLDLMRLKSGDIQTQAEPVELGKLIRSITGDLQFLCGNGAVAFRVDIPPGEVIVNTNRKLIQQVILNLVTNAIKFTPRGQIVIRLEPEAPGAVKIVVEDTGLGIKPEELPLIFNEFYRGIHPDARFKSGVGLGLAIVKKSLELVGGQIDVASMYGQGSTFTVTLHDIPVATAGEDPA